MGRKRKFPVYEKIEITDIAAEGKAIAKIDELIIFVPFVVPGDVVDIQINRKRKNYLEGYVTKFHEYSEKREKPFCQHFGICGGCKWQNLPYKKQLYYKQKQVVDSLERIGGIINPEIEAILPSENTKFYRNKLEFTFSNKRWLTKDEIDTGNEINDMNALGFHVPKMFDKIIDIKNCYLQSKMSDKVRLAVKDYAINKKLSFFDLRKQNGLLRNLIIRNSQTTGELMVIFSFFYEDKLLREELLTFISKKFPEITSLMYLINSKANDTINDRKIELFNGKNHIIEEMEGLKFKIGPKSFFQTNSKQAYNLYKIVRDFADLNGNEIVYDLYTGTGTIANFIAKKSKSVIGIENIPEAIEDAINNSKINNIKNTLFYAGDMKDMLTNEFINKNGKPDIVITDPPRAGMHKNVIDAIIKVSPNKIVYVSCNPATQSRDINLLDPVFEVKKVQPVDMFPHTHHVENVVLLEKR